MRPSLPAQLFPQLLASGGLVASLGAAYEAKGCRVCGLDKNVDDHIMRKLVQAWAQHGWKLVQGQLFSLPRISALRGSESHGHITSGLSRERESQRSRTPHSTDTQRSARQQVVGGTQQCSAASHPHESCRTCVFTPLQHQQQRPTSRRDARTLRHADDALGLLALAHFHAACYRSFTVGRAVDATAPPRSVGTSHQPRPQLLPLARTSCQGELGATRLADAKLAGCVHRAQSPPATGGAFDPARAQTVDPTRSTGQP